MYFLHDLEQARVVSLVQAEMRKDRCSHVPGWVRVPSS